ncbi:uncharacterized protein G2W53_029496 [Senna tora]|uniref:Uncharacterized protein n=1 Tax=Senna tora TaxID=362788 RepID=A0A834WAR9_9FABA|nr:uncharacterized protein G2W53_029496 [Senna tora]
MSLEFIDQAVGPSSDYDLLSMVDLGALAVEVRQCCGWSTDMMVQRCVWSSDLMMVK